uniref:(California timema) hypothetical protein n=1 Tax=Timema californicum TaxID=61474 RepID=A0A7R9P4X5_TIMCA|nr:unnamed protein product [Timema californicum]
MWAHLLERVWTLISGRGAAVSLYSYIWKLTPRDGKRARLPWPRSPMSYPAVIQHQRSHGATVLVATQLAASEVAQCDTAFRVLSTTATCLPGFSFVLPVIRVHPCLFAFQEQARLLVLKCDCFFNADFIKKRWKS